MTQSKPTPKILQVDASGMPQKWISAKDAISYYATDAVIFELGKPVATFRGGYNRITESQSEITTLSIIGINGRVFRNQNIEMIPKLTNESLFERDRYICGYCGELFSANELTRDHIIPACQKGEDRWMNVVTACQPCNNTKGGKTPEQAHMPLLYVPYIPNRYESFILSRGTQGENRILSDQLSYLVGKVDKTSRLKNLKFVEENEDLILDFA